ncbi:MAG: c-type cytochrome [Burkholderiales bacterium]|nr:c-type cytochrome [Burkholderiales bacterium]MDE2394848.1 c-type cytochrome [Burkholderiales bacterium]MDE2452153.1 c-type cytochrome [Burkholderiales bacterium]
MSPTEIRPQQQRENPEPVEAPNPIPWFVIVLTLGLLVFGSVYIVRSHIAMAPDMGDDRTAAELRGQPAPAAGAVLDGAALYAAHCAACHQATGQGLPGVFPPLAASEWVLGKERTLAAIVLHGISGAFTVDGKAYSGAMPAFGAQLKDAEIAAIVSHERSSWGNAASAVTEASVAEVRKSTASRGAPFKGDSELRVANPVPGP